MRDEIYDLGPPTATSPHSPDPNEGWAKLFMLGLAIFMVGYGARLLTLGGVK